MNVIGNYVIYDNDEAKFISEKTHDERTRDIHHARWFDSIEEAEKYISTQKIFGFAILRLTS